MNLNNILNESYFGDLYHYTSLKNARQIVQTNIINTIPFMLSVGDYSHFNEKHYFYISLTRSKLGAYHQPALHSFELVMFVFDGAKLSKSFKTSPVDYWRYTTTKNSPDEDEMEERIFTNKPYIKNISQYIKHIDLVVPNISVVENPHYGVFLENCKKIDVKVRIYTDVQDFYNNKNYIDGTSKKILSTVKSGNFSKIDDDQFSQDSLSHMKFLYNLVAGTLTKSEVDNMGQEKDIYDSLVNTNFSLSRIQRNRLFNYIKEVLRSKSFASRDYAGKIISLLRKKGIKNIDEFLDYLIEKYNKPNSSFQPPTP